MRESDIKEVLTIDIYFEAETRSHFMLYRYQDKDKPENTAVKLQYGKEAKEAYEKIVEIFREAESI